MSLPLVVVATAGSRRWQLLRKAAHELGNDTGARLRLELVPWPAVIRQDGALDGLEPCRRPALVRIESPGEDETVLAELLRAGHRHDPARFTTAAAERAYRYGEIRPPAQLAAGFGAVLGGLAHSLSARPFLQPLADPLAVRELFDKAATRSRLARCGVPGPAGFVPTSVPQLLERVAGWPATYVKLRYGSCGSGIVRLEMTGGEPRGITTVLAQDGRFFNSMRVGQVHGTELIRVLELLVTSGAWAERAVPMVRLAGDHVDLRVVVVAGEPRAVVGRANRVPITNLHLGSRRLSGARIRKLLGDYAWLAALDTAVLAARCFAVSWVGVDLVVDPAAGVHVLELNPFGDLFPGWTDDHGRSLQRLELEAMPVISAGDP